MKKKVLSLCLALALCAGLTVPAAASYSDAVYGTENGHVIPQAKNCSTVTTPDGKFTVTNVVRQKICDSDYYKGHTNCIGVPIYWVADTGTEITFAGAEMGAEFVLSNVLFYEEGHADDNAGPGSYTAPLKIWLNDTEQSDPVHYTDNYYYTINYQGARLFICFAKASEAVPVQPEEPVTPAVPAFTDVPADAVKWAVEKGITTGKTSTTFAPNETCTRAQIMTFLYRAAGSPKPQTEDNPYTDVSPDAYYYKACQWACDLGAVRRGSFSPNAPCTRQTAVQFIWSASDHPEVKTGCPFTDVDQSSHMSGIINWAVEQGITQGKTATTFAPNDTCTRAQIVTFLYRAFA